MRLAWQPASRVLTHRTLRRTTNTTAQQWLHSLADMWSHQHPPCSWPAARSCLSKARQHHSSSTSLVHQLHPIGRLGFTSVKRQYELCGHFMGARAACFSMFEPQSATAQSRRQHVTAGHASAAQRLQVCQCSCPPLHPHLHTKASSGSDAAIIIALQCSCTAAAVAMPAILR